MRKADLSSEMGKRYGELTVIGYAGRSEHYATMVICLCSCGSICINDLSQLKSNRIFSCGCMQNIMRRHKRNTTGVVGVSYAKKSNRYRTKMQYNGVLVYNDCFDNFYQAVLMRRDLELKYYGKTVIDLDKLRAEGIL